MSERFDDLCRVLASQIPRRQALKMIAGLLAGGSLMAASESARSEDPVCPQDKDKLICAAGVVSNPLCCKPGECCRDNTDYRKATKAMCCPKDTCCSDGTAANTFCCQPTKDGVATQCCDAKSHLCCPKNTCCGVEPESFCCQPKDGVPTECCLDHIDLCCKKGVEKCCPAKNRSFALCCNTKTEQCCQSDDGTDSSCCKRETECCDEKTGGCIPKPSCKHSKVMFGPPQQIQAHVQDSLYGIATITITEAVNAAVDIATFTPGTLDPVLIMGTKVDPTQYSRFSTLTCSTQGCCRKCDPEW